MSEYSVKVIIATHKKYQMPSDAENMNFAKVQEYWGKYFNIKSIIL